MKTLSSCLASLLVISSLLSNAFANEESGISALVRQQPPLTEPTKVVAELAASGNANAQYDLGFAAAESGDWATAASWFQKSADNGNANAKLSLSMLIAKGSPQLSFRYAMEAAKAGNTLAIYEVGARLMTGTKGATENKREGIVWLESAAKAGNAMAQFELGTIYFSGDGVPRNLIEAHSWFSVSIAGEFDAVKRTLAEVEKEMTREQIAEATKLARERYEKFGGKK